MLRVEYLFFVSLVFATVLAGDPGADIKKIGEETVQKMEKKKAEIEKQIKDGFREAIKDVSSQIDAMDNVSKAPELSAQLFNKAESFIALVQNIEFALRNFEKQVYQLKMHIYKDNNEGRAKMDATISLHPRGYFSQQIYTNPTN